MAFNLFKKDSLSISRVHVYTATDRPILDEQLSKDIKEKLHNAILMSKPDFYKLWHRSVEKDKIAIREIPAVILMLTPKPVTVRELTSLLQSETYSFLERNLQYSMSQQDGRIFAASCYYDPKSPWAVGPDKLVLSSCPSPPDDKVDPVVMAYVVFFEE
jgi:hypothetical protein